MENSIIGIRDTYRGDLFAGFLRHFGSIMQGLNKVIELCFLARLMFGVHHMW
jgi:hypothetical protein